MKKFALTIGERLIAKRMLNNAGKNLSLDGIRTAMKLLDKLEITLEEFKKAEHDVDQKTNRQKWNEVGSEKDIELSDDQHKSLMGFIDDADKKKEFSIDEGALVLSLVDKLNG